PRNDWANAEEAFTAALQLEKDVNTSLLSLHQIGTVHNDANLCDYLESEFLQEQVDAIKELGDKLTNIRRVGKEAFTAALQLEKDVNTSLLSLHQIGTVHNDANLCD
ncbi:ferritin-like domain-containing protein, partial [Pseudophaeobacter profundi]|uniref:ferritin-like domain-containing protein n=1 Tax=Pseudophaeobacter profundi TaxID=3034152 RepID=UPI00242DD229